MAQAERREKGKGKKGLGISGLFSDFEVKSFFKKYISILVTLEILIFLVCWFYQLGNTGHDRFGPVDIPFPWKTYFLVAFLTPVLVTFFLGVVVVAFDRFFYDRKRDADAVEPDAPGTGGVFRWCKAFTQIPFLVMLILLGLAAGLIYRIDEILWFFGTAGAGALKLFQLVAVVGAVGLTICGLVWMVLAYKLKRQELELRYKADVIERLAIPWEALEKGQPLELPTVPSAAAPPATGRSPEESENPGVEVDN